MYIVEIIYPYFRDSVYPRFLDIITAPIDNLNMLWIVAPLLITLFLVQTYFGRHKDEELGWNTAYGNTIVLIFISINLLHHVYQTFSYEALRSFSGTPFYQSILVLAVFFYAFVLLLIDFSHSLPKKLAFFLSSSITVNVVAFVSIVLVYSSVPFDRVTLVTAICIFVAVWLFFKLFKWIIPPTEEAEKFLEKKEEKKEEKKQEKRLANYKQARDIEHHIKKEIGNLAEKAGEKLKIVKNLFKK